ncbi:MAG: histidine--tRNA ligase [Euryarchaeota archaeon]|nr:histidine--tRNA ligase [Euryarchaeota archaeon]
MIQKLKGFRDMYPETMRARRIVFDKINSTARRFGFHEIDAPSVERLELFRVKSGDEIVKQTFSFEDKGGREITLIPELTPTVARMLASRKDLVKPVKWFAFPKMWRYEEPQSGRLREFYQFNADIFGIEGIEADAEVLALAMEILDSLGLKGKYEMRVSDRILMEELLKKYGVERIEEAFRLIDKKDKIPEEAFYEELRNICGEDAAEKLMDILKLRGAPEQVLESIDIGERKDTLLKLSKLLKAYGKEIVLDLSIVRGLAYYTGIVFEAHDARGEFRAILGGGRYDNVVELFGGTHTPAVGFGMGDAVLELIMKREGVWPEERVEVDYFIAIVPGFRERAIEVAMQLRKAGASVDIDLSNRSLGKQMKYANRINAKFVVIVGEEIEKGEVVVKNMESGVQETVRLSEITG